MRKEGRFPFISWFDSYVVVAPSDIEFGEECTFCQAVNRLWNKGHRVAVLSRPFVNGTIVLHWSEFSVALLYEKEVSGVGAPGFSDSASFEVFLYELAHFSLFSLGEG
jgi:hypothetical protein